MDELGQLLSGLVVDEDSDVSPALQKAVLVARELQRRGVELQTPEERRQQAELERMMGSSSDKVTLTQMTDQAFRSRTPRRAADQLTHILDVQGVPRFFSTLDRAMLKGFQSFGSYLPGVSIPMVKDKMREETANVVLPAEAELLAPYLRKRREGGVRMNVNYLGEALLGEGDARRRLKSYLAALQLPDIEVMSVKVSTIYSQITPISRRHAVKVLCDRMELLYRAAHKERFTRGDGTVVPKFVYLDMEEYRDLGVTVEVFMKTLDRPGLEQVNAGIALQAYIPDSYLAQREINAWANKRVAAGGAPVTIRLVKGANLEMERVEASIEGWPQAPYRDKIDTDANYKRMLHEAIDNTEAVRLGVASHNLFEVAYALVLANERGVLEHLQFEMLEGMANHQRRALCELASNVLLYAPATRKEEFINAIGYLLRRLDENTGEENFLRHAFKLDPDSETWRTLELGFLASHAAIDKTPYVPRRTQDRNEEPDAPPLLGSLASFDNEPDTDFSLPHNVAWAEGIIEKWKARCDENAPEIPIVVAGEDRSGDRKLRSCSDPSRPGVVVGRYRQATIEDIDEALACAATDPAGWRTLSDDDRSAVMNRVAHELRKARGDLMGAAAADGGKLLTQSDPEVSEAIDFVQFYAVTARELRALETVRVAPLGVVVVVPPWNFPIAIPCGGVAAALAAGNTVILKPASDTVLVAYELCRCFWEAGVPKEALQFVPCSGATGGAHLVASDVVDAVILTGGTNTALRMLAARPRMNLLAETGGKNATIVTAMSDREQAVKHVVQSAFGHSGQKCSATSLLILEGEVYDEEAFQATLVDAVESLKVGSAWDLDTKMGPMVKPPSGDLERGLKELEKGETWAVMPRMQDDNPSLYSPAVKLGVAPGSYTHMTEFFGPVLAVMRADNVEHAIDLVNETGYGLTSGLESLDKREQAVWRDAIVAGNLYINRVTTGAIVLRQPFGGVGKSAFGPGIKAGGPNYVAQLMRFEDDAAPKPGDRPVSRAEVEVLRKALRKREDSKGLPIADRDRVLAAIDSYDHWHSIEFGRLQDDFKLVGQDNLRRYKPVPNLRIRIHPEDSPFEIFARVCAAKIANCRVTVSSPTQLESPTVLAALRLLDRLTEWWGAGIEFVTESDADLVKLISTQQTDRVRYADPARVPTEVLAAVGDTGIYIATRPVLVEGRLELLQYLTEQSISHDYHRYGNLGARSGEPRHQPD